HDRSCRWIREADREPSELIFPGLFSRGRARGLAGRGPRPHRRRGLLDMGAPPGKADDTGDEPDERVATDDRAGVEAVSPRAPMLRRRSGHFVFVSDGEGWEQFYSSRICLSS